MSELQDEYARLREWEDQLRKQEETLLDRATEQALLLTILRKMREKSWLKVDDLLEIEHASRLNATDDYRPTEKLGAIVRRTRLEEEAKRKRPT